MTPTAAAPVCVFSFRGDDGGGSVGKFVPPERCTRLAAVFDVEKAVAVVVDALAAVTALAAASGKFDGGPVLLTAFLFASTVPSSALL